MMQAETDSYTEVCQTSTTHALLGRRRQRPTALNGHFLLPGSYELEQLHLERIKKSKNKHTKQEITIKAVETLEMFSGHRTRMTDSKCLGRSSKPTLHGTQMPTTWLLCQSASEYLLQPCPIFLTWDYKGRGCRRRRLNMAILYIFWKISMQSYDFCWYWRHLF